MTSKNLESPLFENLSNISNISMCSMCTSPRGERVYFVPSYDGNQTAPNDYEYEVTNDRIPCELSDASSDKDNGSPRTRTNSQTENVDKITEAKDESFEEMRNDFLREQRRSIDQYLSHESDPSILSNLSALKNSDYCNVKFEPYKTKNNRLCYSCILPVVCDRSNTSFYSQCKTQKEGYCCNCCKVVTNNNNNNNNKNNNKHNGNNKHNDNNSRSTNNCRECGGRLAAKYHQWYPNLVSIEALPRSENIYYEHKNVLNTFGIKWNHNNARKRKDISDNYLLLRFIFDTIPDCYRDIRSLHLERSFMIGVFAGRKFNTTRKGRQFLKKHLKLVEFNRRFPPRLLFGKESHIERIAIADKLNKEFFYGHNVAYFHAHKLNIEGYFDPDLVNCERVHAAFDQFLI